MEIPTKIDPLRGLGISLLTLTAAGLSYADVIVQADYAAPGYADGNLQFQNGWLGQAATQVDSTGAGSAYLVGGPSYSRNSHGNGARGGVGGVPTTEGNFEQYETIKISFGYQFELSSDVNTAMAVVGIRSDGPNAENGYEAAPQQGFKMQYNAYDLDPMASDDGSVKFYPDLNDSANSQAMFVEGVDLGIHPGTGDGGSVDLVSDPLTIEYLITNNGLGGWDVTSFVVTNNTTEVSYTYGGPAQSFDWFESDPETDAYQDAFFAQQLAPTGDTGFVSTTTEMLFEYDAAPATRPIYTSDFTTAEGYNAGNLQNQQGWVGQAGPTVDPAGSGDVTGFTFQRNMYNTGLRGSSGGVLTTEGDFTPGESVRVVVDYQFTLGGSTNTGLGILGFRSEGPNSGNGFEAAPQEGMSMEYSGFNVGVNGGGVKFWPDLNDEGLGNGNALIISGHEVGVDPADALSQGVDLVSDPLQIIYELEIGGDELGTTGEWFVKKLVVINKTTEQAYCYEGPDQAIEWLDVDAFWAQQYVRSSNGASAVIDRVELDFLAVQDPATMPTIGIDFTYTECYSSGSLAGQNGWLGQTLALVDASGSGTASSSGGPYDRNYYGESVRGGTGGAFNPVGDFASGDVIEIEFDYQFTLAGDANEEMVKAGLTDAVATNPSAQVGFKLQYNVFDPGPDTDGSVKFFPDFGGAADDGIVVNADALILEGLEVGIDPGAPSPDLESAPLRITAVYTNDGAGRFDVTSFTVTNLSSGMSYEYTGGPQSFPWSQTDAFFAQQLAPNGNAGFTGATDGMTITYTEGAVSTEFKVTSVAIVGGDLVVDFVGTPGASYVLTESPNLSDPFLDTGLTPVVADVEGVGTFTLPGPLGTENFLRVEDE